MTITPAEIRDFILEFQNQHGRAPLYKEIMDSLGIKSSSTVFTYLNKLGMVLVYVEKEEKGQSAS